MQGGIRTVMGPVEWLMLLTFAFLWATSYLFTAIALRDVPVMTFTFWRSFMAAVMLYALCRIAGLSLPRGRKVWLAMIAMSFLNNALPNVLLFWGQKTIPPGLAAIMIAGTPFFTVLLAQVFTSDEKLTAGKLIGVVLGFLGVGSMIGLSLVGAAGSSVLAEVAIVFAAVSLACAGIYGRRVRTLGIDTTVLATVQTLISLTMFFPLYLVIEQPWQAPFPGLGSLGWMAAAAIGGGALSPILYFRLLERAGATNVVLTTFLTPVFSVILSAIFWGERLELRHAAGMALIGLGLSAIDGRLWSRWRRSGARG